MVDIIEIECGSRGTSRIVVGDARDGLSEFLPAGRRVIAIVDERVLALHGKLTGDLERIVIPAGERNKTLENAETIYRELIELGADRRTFIVGIGGGVVTDITGFVASTYMRGVDFGFVATTLTAQVDAAVGGKNGVNVAGFKNMVGTFDQPGFVICDTGLLKTLSPREFRTGLAEMIKAGVIADPELFELLEAHSPEQLQADTELLTRTVAAAIRVKARMVEADEREKGERRKLNLGHTVGHAIEHLTGEFTHGEAVATGIAVAAEAGVKLGLLAARDKDRIVKALEKAGLPTELPEADIRKSDIIRAITRDKKIENEKLWFVVPQKIGEVAVRRTSLDELATLI